MAHTSRLSAVRVLQFLIIAGMFVAAFLLYPYLPAQVPTHWGVTGQVDQYSSKAFGTWLLPILTLVMTILFPVLQRLDPKSENYPAFSHTWKILQLCFTAFFAYIFAVQMFATLHPEQSAMVGRYIICGVGVLFVIIGNYMGKIRQNFFIGLRTPWSLSDPEVWQKSQRFGGWAFVLGGLAIIIQGAFFGEAPAVFFSIIALMVVLPIAYSFFAFKKKSFSLFAILSLAAFAAALLLVLLRSGSEDTWRCEHGKWVPHGNPSAPMPTDECK